MEERLLPGMTSIVHRAAGQRLEHGLERVEVRLHRLVAPEPARSAPVAMDAIRQGSNAGAGRLPTNFPASTPSWGKLPSRR